MEMKTLIKKLKYWLWSIRKTFNITNKKEEALIKKQYDLILEMAKADDSDYSRKQWRNQDEHDGTCPHCGNKESSKIVNRIARVKGSGSVGGSFSLGFGSVHGSSSTDTSEINHCNKCGNEWKKYEYKTKWQKDFLGEYLDHIAKHSKDDWDWYNKTVERFQAKGIYAETFIYLLVKTNFYNGLYSDTPNVIKNLSYMRSLFPSVYDVTQP